jgi:hypothetical protein
MKRTLIVVLLSLLGLGGISAGAWAFSGSEGASFLDVPVGAAPAALGSAYTALANDAYAPVWNPAGLGFLDGTQVGGMHQAYVDKTSFEYLSLVHTLTPGHALGFSIQYFRPGDMDLNDINGNTVGTFGGYYSAYSLSYGQRLSDTLALGLTGKMISAKIESVSATAYAGDAGLFYRPDRRLTLATVIANLGSKIKFIQEGDPLPLALRAGAAYRVTEDLKVVGEGVAPKAGQPSFHFGVEWPSEEERGFCVRTGYATDRIRGLSPLAGVTVGVGIPVWGHELSYAWLPLGDFGSTHYFSLVMRFGETQQKEVFTSGNGNYDHVKEMLNENEQKLIWDSDDK